MIVTEIVHSIMEMRPASPKLDYQVCIEIGLDHGIGPAVQSAVCGVK
jgi:hypothetical protein